MSIEIKEVPDYEVARQELNTLFDSLKIPHEISGPVPSCEDGWPSLRFTLSVKGFNFDYRMGVGHVRREEIQRAARSSTCLLGRLSNEEMSAVLVIEKNGWVLKDKPLMSHLACKLFNKKDKPTIADILGSVSRDAEAHDMSFDEWCVYYGYDPDSIKDKSIYDACVKGWHDLRKIGLTAEQINKIAEIHRRL